MNAIKKTIVIATLALVMVTLYGVDFLIARQYRIDVIDVTPESTYADGKSEVQLVVQVIKGDEPQREHLLSAIAINGGDMKSRRVVTDENGMAKFIYYPYVATSFSELRDTVLRISDLSNSVFISVPTQMEVKIKILRPENKDTGKTTSDLFG